MSCLLGNSPHESVYLFLVQSVELIAVNSASLGGLRLFMNSLSTEPSILGSIIILERLFYILVPLNKN